MKLANLDGRATLVTDAGIIDVAHASGHALTSNPDQAIVDLAAIRAWYRDQCPVPDPVLTREDLTADMSRLRPPVTAPRQIFAVGLNYLDHGTETGIATPNDPMIFTKFSSSITGPASPIRLPSAVCDWEVELVAVVGRGGRDLTLDNALDALAGFCVGQDISERDRQMAGTMPQFSLAKSYDSFAPIGPWLTTIDEVPNPNDLSITATLDGEVVQSARTSDMIFSVTHLVSYLSRTCRLLPGDLIFTGTPAGVGYTRTPARYLKPGSVLVSSIERLGELRNVCVSTAPAASHVV